MPAQSFKYEHYLNPIINLFNLKKMKKNLRSTKLAHIGAAILLLLFISVNSAFAASISWDNGGGDNNWATATNWSGDVLPGSGDDVFIGSFTVNISTGTFTINSLNIYGSSPTPMLTIASGATLNVITTTGTNDAVQIGGGVIQNSGSFSITSIGDKSGVTLKNGSGTDASILTNMTGATLTVNTTASATAGSAYNGPCINFTQSNATAVFTANGTVTLTPATALKHTALLMQGNSKGALLGSGFTVPTGSYGFFFYQGLEFTIGQAVGVSPTINFSIVGTGVNDTDAMNFSTNSGSTFINYGTINITGTNPNGLVTYHNAVTPLNITNNGTISVNGAFNANGAATLNGASGKDINVFNNNSMSFTNTLSGKSGLSVYSKATLTNSGSFSIVSVGLGINNYSSDVFTLTNDASKTVTINSTGSGALNLASNAANGGANINNNGTMTLISVGGNGIGNASSTLTNGATGILTFNTSIQSTGGSLIPTFINNGNAIMNTGTNTGINANVTFTNNKTLKGTGAITPSTTSLAPSTSEISPGNSSASKIVLSGATNTINGKFSADVNGATTAGTNYDQLDATTAAASVNVGGLTIATTFGYTPTNGDAIVLINTNAGTITGTPTFTPALPAGWAATTTGGQVKLTFTTVLPVKLVSFVGTKEANSNLLTWVTASETNNLGFEIQRKASATTWETLGFVKAEGKPATYKFTDANPVATSYYRLRQLDNDNTESFSNIVAVKQNLNAKLNVSPNPATDFVNVSIPNDGVSSSSSTANVFDLSGKKVISQINNSASFKIDVTSLKKGTYIISLENNGSTFNQKLIKQ